MYITLINDPLGGREIDRIPLVDGFTVQTYIQTPIGAVKRSWTYGKKPFHLLNPLSLVHFHVVKPGVESGASTRRSTDPALASKLLISLMMPDQRWGARTSCLRPHLLVDQHPILLVSEMVAEMRGDL